MKSIKYNDLLCPLKEIGGKELWIGVRKMINMPLEFKEEFMIRFIGRSDKEKTLKNTLFYKNEEMIDKFIIAIAVLGGWK